MGVVDRHEDNLYGRKDNMLQAAQYLVPGLVAHESAMKGGELMPVPDFGEPKQQ